MPTEKRPAQKRGRPREIAPATALARLIVQTRGARSLDDLAAQVGVDRSTWYRWESGEVVPPVSRILALAEVLGVPAKELLAAMLQ